MTPDALDQVCSRCHCEAEIYPQSGGIGWCADCLGEQVESDLDLLSLPRLLEVA